MSNWLYYRTLTIDHDVIDSSLTDYPVMVKLDDTNFNFSKIRSDGYDLIFMDSSGTTQLKHEVELFDGVNKKAVYHVKIPSVSDTVDTTFRMYYGESGITTDQSDKTNVWDSNFVMVQHMGDSLIDSTGNGNDGTNYGSTVVDGLNGKARSFDGVNDYIQWVSNGLGVFDNANFTIQNIFKTITTSIRYQPIWSYDYISHSTPFYSQHLRIDDGNRIYEGFNLNGEFTGIFTENVILTLNQEHLLSLGFENGYQVECFDGSLIHDNKTGSPNYYNQEVWSGKSNISNAWFKGTIDEVRISNIARSDAWIKADDYNLRTYSLLSLGTETSNKTIIGIELLQEPTKTEYFLGESLDLTGALVEITYDDETTQQIEPTSASGFDSSVESLSQTVTISLGGFSESFNVVIRNDYTIGQKIAIKFTENIVGDVSGFTPEPMAEIGFFRPVGVASASSHYSASYTPNKAFDGNTTGSYWYTNTAGEQWIQIKLHAPVSISGFRWYVDYNRPKDFVLEGSHDGVDWHSLISDTSPDVVGWAKYYTDTLSRFTHFRWRILNRYTSNLSIYEIQLFGVSGNEYAFTVTGSEYQYVNGPIVDMTYSVNSVERYPVDSEDTLRLVMHPQSRFNNVEGDLTVDYDASKGNLLGRGGAVESFSYDFTPVGLETKPNPHAAEIIALTSYVNIDFIRVAYTSAYEEEKITVTPNATVVFTYVGTINP